MDANGTLFCSQLAKHSKNIHSLNMKVRKRALGATCASETCSKCSLGSGKQQNIDIILFSSDERFLFLAMKQFWLGYFPIMRQLVKRSPRSSKAMQKRRWQSTNKTLAVIADSACTLSCVVGCRSVWLRMFTAVVSRVSSSKSRARRSRVYWQALPIRTTRVRRGLTQGQLPRGLCRIPL